LLDTRVHLVVAARVVIRMRKLVSTLKKKTLKRRNMIVIKTRAIVN